MHNQRKKIKLILLFTCLTTLLILVSCSQPTEISMITEAVEETEELPYPAVVVTKSPDAAISVRQFFSAWENDDYEEMYQLISAESKDQISLDDFTDKYLDFAREMALLGLSYQIETPKTHPNSAQIAYELMYDSSLFGEIIRNSSMDLVFEDNQWHIIWDDALILPELAGGNILRQDPIIPERESIYAADSSPMATRAEAVAVGVYPDLVNLEESEGLLTWLSRISGLRVESVIQKIENSFPGEYLPIAEVLAEESERIINTLSGYGSVVIGRYDSRYYPDGGIAPHVVGYVSAIQQDEVDDFRRLGYQSFEKVGRDGLEEWGESYLSGTRGGSLFIIDPDGNIVGTIAQSSSSPGSDIYTTIDYELQEGVQEALRGLRGAAVILERDTGKVLAMASSPGYNPNGFQTENINWDSWLSDLYSDPNTPLFNRATQGQYPLGSVFKIITMAAALESGVYTPETTYECGYFFDEAPGLDLNDWTYDWFLEDGETQPSGLLTLPQGLIRSCNPYFWHIGLDLYESGMEGMVPDMARGFGLGELTGIVGLEEEPGNVPDPEEPVDAINLAIGQGELLVTPLQVANFVAAIGNGGTLNRPWVVDRVVGSNGTEIQKFGPEAIGSLPVSEENLEVIQEAMQGVVSSRDPRGTAYNVFNGFRIPIAGKTGTAESSGLEPHAWFVAYSLAEREDKPDIAIAVIIENAGEGSEWAAPVVRRILELYYFGSPQRLYPWEAGIGLTKTPTPLFSETPTPDGDE